MSVNFGFESSIPRDRAVPGPCLVHTLPAASGPEGSRRGVPPGRRRKRTIPSGPFPLIVRQFWGKPLQQAAGLFEAKRRVRDPNT